MLISDTLVLFLIVIRKLSSDLQIREQKVLSEKYVQLNEWVVRPHVFLTIVL